MSIDSQTLKKIDIFCDLDPEELNQIASISRHVKVVEGEIIIQKGSAGQKLFVILSGHYMIFAKDGKAFTLDAPGDLLGVTTLTEQFHYKDTAVALTDGELIALGGEDLITLIRGDSILGNKVMNKLNSIIEQRITLRQNINIVN